MTTHLPETEIDYRARVGRALRAIEVALDSAEPVAPAALAEVAGFSLHHFHRVFRGVTGESIEEHVRRLRLERAARRLRAGPHLSIVQVATEAGYGSHEAFTRAFRDLFGVPPSRWRGGPPSRQAAPIDELAVELREIPEIALVTRRLVGPCTGIPDAFEHVFAWAGARGVVPANTRTFGLYHDDPDITPPAFLRSDVGLETTLVPGAASGLERRTIAAGRYAVALHRGPYSTIGATYLALIGRWAAQARADLAPEPLVELYLNSPADTEPQALRTEIWMRLGR